MEEVPGIPGLVPPLAMYPEASVKANLPPAEWEACLDSWLSSIEFRLRLQDVHFSKFRFSQPACGVEFLMSFFRSVRKGESVSESAKDRLLVKRSYLLLRRLLLSTEVPFEYDASELVQLLGFASLLFSSVVDWKTTLKSLWKRNSSQLTGAVEGWKKIISVDLASRPDTDTVLDSCRRMNSLVRVSAETGLVLMTGSDFLETLMETFTHLQTTPSTEAPQRVLTEHIFYCLRSLMSDGSAHGPLLLDHLYFMKSEAERSSKSKAGHATLCSSLVCNTSFLRHLAADNSVTSGKRGQGLLEFLTSYQQNTMHLHPPIAPRRRRVTKGKGKAHPNEEMHMHKASQISQVHDLFPDLSNHYILKLLDHFHDDTEAVVAALLEPESLPPDLRDSSAHNEPLAGIAGPAFDLAPHSTPPLLPERKNVFDGDDFDRLRISADKLHRGRRDIKTDNAGTGDQHVQRKAAIMSALAAFDSDDDERDDTYDIADVGGTVDSTLDTDVRPRPERGPDQNPHEESLFRAWKDNPELFARDSTTRVSKVRQDLKRETGMSDEQIEGWAIMLKKDSKLRDRLDRKYAATSTFRGNQGALASTRWQGDTPEESEEGEQRSGGQRSGQSNVRGGRNWGRGRGRGAAGSTSGPRDEASTQAARRRKEQGRGRGGASHNRREGRARKMAKGMTGPAE